MFRAGSENLKEQEYLLLGKVTRPFGIRGEVRVHTFNPFSETLEHVDSLLLRSQDGKTQEFKIAQVRTHQNFYLVRFEGVNDRDLAESLRDREILVRKDQLARPKEGEFYWFELIGMDAVGESGKEIGKVVAIEETNPYLGGNDILVINTEGGEIMVPITEKQVKKVDLTAKKIIISGLEDFKK
jgi:16S rRNA processing protein RimM